MGETACGICVFLFHRDFLPVFQQGDSCVALLGALVNFSEKDFEDGPGEETVDRGLESHDLLVAVLLVCPVKGLKVEVPVEGFHLGDLVIVPRAVVFLPTNAHA
jgi:hypothetical protein